MVGAVELPIGRERDRWSGPGRTKVRAKPRRPEPG
jgi:hypothetical protein